MAKTVKIRDVVYDNVPYVKIPNANNPSIEEKFYDTSSSNVSASDIRQGKTGFGANGSVSGNLATVTPTTTKITTKTQEVQIAAGIHSAGGVVKIDESAVQDLTSDNLRKGCSALGVNGGFDAAVISQDASTKVLSIS